jgi:hypothetical protein
MIEIPRISKEEQEKILEKKLEDRTKYALLTDKSTYPDEYLENQLVFLDLCKSDWKFFVNNCIFIQDPEKRDGESKDIPFFLWDYQEKCGDEIVKAIEDGHDISLDKARKVGATWLILAIFLWQWHFHKADLLIGGRKLEDVDKRGDLGTLFQKIRFMIERLPKFIFPIKLNNFTDKVALLVHPNHGATIAGEGNCANFGRSDRRKAVFLDEYSSWEANTEIAAFQGLSATTKCRITCSTPNRRGTNCFFYEIVQDNIKNNKPHLRINWRLHPVFADGLRPTEETDLAKKHFLLSETSPWLEHEIERATDLTSVAQEILIDYSASMSGKVFPSWDSTTQIDESIEYDPSLPIYGGMDIGLDQIAMIWVQPYRNQIRVIDEYVCSNEDIYHAIDIIESKDYKNAIWYVDPWSGGSRNVTSKLSPATIMKKHGIIFKFKRTSVGNFVQSGRNLLSRTMVSPKCTLFIDMMENWQMKKPRSGDTKSGVLPEHSEYSHIGTAWYYFAFNFSKSSVNRQPAPRKVFTPNISGVII